ncbi:MAG: hypothetical protein HY290_08360 [Planctomycetia bacterium]|nr:hypothetical protein [Planctomycetia bacterium]
MDKYRKFAGTFEARCADGTRVKISHYVEILRSPSSAGTSEVEGDHVLFDEQKQEVQRLKKGHYEIRGSDGEKIIAISDDPDAP